MNNQEERKILVTGATGTVGIEVVKQLVSTFTNKIIRAAVHSKKRDDKIRQFADKGVEIVELDYTKPETMTNALNAVDKLFLLIPDAPNAHELASNLVEFYNSVWSNNEVPKCILCSCRRCKDEFYRC